jgi:hypothetical protein
VTFAEPLPDGVRLRIRVQPRASRTEVAGLHGDALKIRLSAPPVDGAANEALIRFLADALGVPRGAVNVAAGHASRSKTVRVIGVTVERAEALLGTGR